MKILTVPEATEILRRKSEPAAKIDAELLAFLKELGETLKSQKDPAGVGLSAIQVGKPLRVFATFLPRVYKGPALLKQGRALSETKPKLTFYVNPEIVEHSEDMTLGEELVQSSQVHKFKSSKNRNDNNQTPDTRHQTPFLEGCLSIPRIYGAVLRWPWIKAKAMVLTELYKGPALPRQGRAFSQQFNLDDLAARVFQHEIDHLNGVLFTDHVLAQENKFYQDTGDGPEEINL